MIVKSATRVLADESGGRAETPIALQFFELFQLLHSEQSNLAHLFDT